jgi:glyoxylase I family protein
MSIPGMRGSDHIGFTVPDLDAAEEFLVGVLGAQYVYSLGPKGFAEGDFMAEKLGVHPRATIRDIRLYRLGNGTNLEVFQYDTPDGQTAQPRNSDIGGHHIAIYVDDMDAAVRYLREQGVEVMGEPFASSGLTEGQSWVYFKAPWGMQFELVSAPNGKAYEKDADVVLWKPTHPGV